MEEYSELRRSISTYIEKFPTSTREGNSVLLTRIHNLRNSKEEKDIQEITKAREKVVLSNGGFAMKYVMRYKSILNDDVSIMDLFQEANLGLIEAVDTFDIALKTSFTTYAFFHIRKRIIDFIKKNKIVRAPRDIARNMKHVNEIKGELFSEFQREPLTVEIVKALKERRGIILSTAMIDNIVVLLELNSAGYEESFISEFTEQIASDDILSDADVFKRMELNLLKELESRNERYVNIVRLRFGIGKDYPHSLEEIKFMLGITDAELPK